MAAPTKSFITIADSAVDPDSPVTTTLLSALQGNDENLNSQLIGETSPFVAAQKHNHDGINSALILGGLSLKDTFGGTSHTLLNSSSNLLMVDIVGNAQVGTPTTIFTMSAPLVIELTGFTMDGTASVTAAEIAGNTISDIARVVTNHNGTSLPDNTFVTVVTLGLNQTITFRIRFNRTTKVLDIDATGGDGRTVGMRVMEFIKG